MKSYNHPSLSPLKGPSLPSEPTRQYRSGQKERSALGSSLELILTHLHACMS